MKKFALFIFAICYFGSSFSQEDIVKVGGQVDLSKHTLVPLGNVAIKNNKPIVLDFWATWCAPCIGSFRYLDSFQTKYKDKLQVIAVSDEPVEKVAKFLMNKKYSFSFFNDTAKSLFRFFGIESRPLTALLSPKAELLWVGFSSELEKIIVAYLQGRPLEAVSTVNLTTEKYYTKVALGGGIDNPLFLYRIGMNNRSGEYLARIPKGTSVDSAIDIRYKAVPVTEVIMDMLDVSDLAFLNSRKDLDTTYIDLIAKSSTPLISYRNKNMSSVIISDLEKIFKFGITKTTREVSGLRIGITDRIKLAGYKETIDGGGMVNTDGKNIDIIRMSLEQAALYFQKKLMVPVRSNMDGKTKYNFRLQTFGTIEGLNMQLKQYGLTLVKASSKLDFIEVR